MDEQGETGNEPENISDIQNYLVSFNKEIQDGGQPTGAIIQVAAARGSSGTTTGGEPSSTTTFFVAQPAPDGFQYSSSNQAHFESGTYYTSSDGSTFYATTGDQSSQVQYAAYQAASADQTSAQAFQTTDGLQQIVLTVNDAALASSNANSGAANTQDINVSLGDSSIDESIVKTESSALDSTESTAEHQTTAAFVAMQPSSNEEANQHELAAALIAQANEVGHHQTIRMVVRQPDGTEAEQAIPVPTNASAGPTLITSDGQEIHVSDESTLQMMANLAEHADGVANNQVLLNAGGNAYQTVTIVPSDTNPGEVSYVLIVSQSDDVKDEKEDVDMSVYDFTEAEKHSATGQLVREDIAADGSKLRTIKITQKKGHHQVVSQAHMCNYCNYTSPKRYLLTRHMKSHSEERPHKCTVCERGFKTLASLQNHLNTHTGTRPHQCKDCESCFTTSGELVRHVRYRHTHEKPHRCTECDYASVELSKLKRHMRCHTGERPYQCPHCTYASPDTYKLKRHLRIHTGEKPYECDICHSRFTQSNSLKAHKLIHSGNKPVFQCEFCPTTCGRKTDLRIHVQKLHTSDRPLKCKRCGKSFPDRYSYKLHVKSHEGEKCFKCDLCSYASISHRHLESHMLIHTDQKPFRCDECNQSFRQKQLLKRHKNLYHDPNYMPPVPKEKTHECPECGKAFRHKGNLMRHMSLHDPEATADEREAALKIGQPKQPGEQPDGEEDFVDEYVDDETGMAISASGAEQNHVVVFELVDYTDQQQRDLAATLGENAIAMATTNGTLGEGGGVTILQQLEGSNLEEVAAAVAQVHGEDASSRIIVPLGATPITATKSTPPPARKGRGRPRKYPLAPSSVPNSAESSPPPNNTPTSTPISVVSPSILNKNSFTAPKKRGRPRKFPGPNDVSRPYVVPLTKVELEGDDQDQTYSPRGYGGGRPSTPSGERSLRRRQAIDYEALASEGFKKIKTRGRPPKNQTHLNNALAEEEDEDEEELYDMTDGGLPPPTDPEEIARREEELQRKRLEEKERDMAECFGFNEDEEESEAILAMPAAPGAKPLVYNDISHQNGGE